MNCPNCGAETNEAICPVCGMNLGTANGNAPIGGNMPEQTFTPNQEPNANMGMAQPNPYAGQGMNMQQNLYPNQDMNMQQNPYPNQDMNMQQNPYPNQGMDMSQNFNVGMDDTQPKSKTGMIVGIIIGAAVVVAAAIVALALIVGGGARKCEKIVDEFMEGMAEGDAEKMVSNIDSDCVADSDVEELAYSFELIKAYGMEYSVDYEILETKKASDDIIEEMCDSLYGDDDVADDISKAYVSKVEYSVTASYLGETQTEEDTMYLVCYKKDGEWYLGGTVEEE